MPTREICSHPLDQPALAVCASPAHTIEPRDFVQHHRPSLERDNVRHNLILSILDRLALDPPPNLRRSSRGAPGACAAQSPGYPIVLGELTQAQRRALAEETRELDYPGVVVVINRSLRFSLTVTGTRRRDANGAIVSIHRRKGLEETASTSNGASNAARDRACKVPTSLRGHCE
jgi:hypothetical protein